MVLCPSFYMCLVFCSCSAVVIDHLLLCCSQFTLECDNPHRLTLEFVFALKRKKNQIPYHFGGINIGLGLEIRLGKGLIFMGFGFGLG